LYEEGEGIGHRLRDPGHITHQLALDVRIGHPAQQGFEHREFQIEIRIRIDVVGQSMGHTPGGKVHHAQIKGVHLPVVPTMEVVVGHDHRPAEGHTRQDQSQKAVVFGTGNAQQVERHNETQVNELKEKYIFMYYKYNHKF